MKALFKTFFPTWNFFDQYSHNPILQFKLHSEENWQNLFRSPKRKIYHWLLNPEVNYQYACNNHILQWIQELQKTEFEITDNLKETADYAIALQMVTYELKRQKKYQAFQFRIQIEDPITGEQQNFLTSKVHSSP